MIADQLIFLSFQGWNFQLTESNFLEKANTVMRFWDRCNDTELNGAMRHSCLPERIEHSITLPPDRAQQLATWAESALGLLEIVFSHLTGGTNEMGATG